MIQTAHGQPVLDAAMRCEPADFFVDEQLGFEPDGEGEHRLLRIRKTGCNTQWVAAQLASIAQIPVRDVSFAGRKDRHAITEQWFSVRMPGRSSYDWPDTSDQGFEILAEHEHKRKLRRGALKGNRFRLVLKNVNGDSQDIEQRLQRLVESGIPNYFGQQRFGRNGQNVAKARALFAGRRCKKRERDMLLSAARAELFNRVLAVRVERGDWDKLLAGDVAGLAGSNSSFTVAEPDQELLQRLAGGDIHPTGPLWGRGELRTTGVVRELEAQLCSGMLAAGLETQGLRQDRRKLRVMVNDLNWLQHRDASGRQLLTLNFFLPAGSYATALLNELGSVSDMAVDNRNNTDA
jgi:tRNA pseudouridine13 synthase